MPANFRRRRGGSPRSRLSRPCATCWSTGGRARPLRTLVTGVAGFVGRHLTREFARRSGEELYGADIVPLEAHRADDELRAHLKSYRTLDVADFEPLLACVQDVRPDRIVHLAAQSSG